MTVERFDALGSDYDESPTGMFVYAKDYDALAARLAEAERLLTATTVSLRDLAVKREVTEFLWPGTAEDKTAAT